MHRKPVASPYFWGLSAEIVLFIANICPSRLVHSSPFFRKFDNDFINCSCGKFQAEKRYVDGSQITDGRFPWSVGVLNGRDPELPLCYGALISDRHVLTAASCVLKKKSYEINVYFYGRDIPASFHRRRSVRGIEAHEEYTSLNHNNNLAILTLAIPIDLEYSKGNNTIAPICIPNPFVFSGKIEKMRGLMTKMQFYKSVLVASPRFYFGTVPMKIHGARNPTCSNIFSERPKDKVLCSQLEGHCYGDLGSPLTITLSETGKPVSSGGRYYVLGIYSKGYGCDGYESGKSGVDVSTNVMSHIDWIIRRTIWNGNFCS